jgi:hypothetical protein
MPDRARAGERRTTDPPKGARSAAAPPALGNRAVARSVAKAPGRPRGRGMTPESALVARVSAGRQLMRTPKKVSTSAGEFSIDNYDPVDTDKDNDTSKTCGINIDVTYTPPDNLKSTKIGFVQMMKCLKGDGTPLLFANETPRATTAESGDAGWAVDRLKDMKWGYYGMEDTGTAGGNLTLGSRTDKNTFTAAFMHDQINLGRDQGKTAGCTAMTFAIDIEHGKYLGGFSWGYSVDASGKVTANDLGEADMGAVQRAAIAGWNAQAAMEAAKRNAPDQQVLPTPPLPMGDFPLRDPNATTGVG